MHGPIHASLRLLKHRAVPELLPDQVMMRLNDSADWLAPVVRLGLECRLTDGPGAVDISQSLRAVDGGPQHLGELARRRRSSATGRAVSIWRTVEGLAEMWAADATVGEAPLRDVWLEYDLHEPLNPASVPSIFVGLRCGELESEEPLLALFRLLGSAYVGDPLVGSLRRAAEVTREFGGNLFPLAGVMLPRGGQTRVMIANVPAALTCRYLRGLGWRGREDPVETLAERVLPMVSEFRIVLEFAPDLQQHVGFELLLDGSGDDALRRQHCLRSLVDLGLCAPPKVNALAGWPAVETPLTLHEQWPDEFVVESLRRQVDEFAAYRRILNHLKVGVSGDGRTVVKAYLGFALDYIVHRDREAA